MGFNYFANDDSFLAVCLMLVVYLLSAAFTIVCYVFESLGMYTIAKRRTIKHPWLAWIPAINVWMLGCISDQYRYVAKGKVTNRRKILLALSIVTAVLSCVLVGCYIDVLARVITQGNRLYYMDEEQLVRMMIVPLMSTAGLGLVSCALAIVQVVFEYMSLYDLYSSCDPRNNVLFLVLSILFNVTQPFFIFACRNKDLGMPPRRPAAPPAWQPMQTPPELRQPDGKEE